VFPEPYTTQRWSSTLSVGWRGVRSSIGIVRSMSLVLLTDPNVHLVHQRLIGPGADLPTGIASCLGNGHRVIASVDPMTPAAELLDAGGGAVLVQPEAPAEPARTMEPLHEQADLRIEFGRPGRAHAEGNLARDATLERFERVLLG